MIPTAFLVVVSLVYPISDQVAVHQQDVLTVLEGKLHGEWKGGPCAGDWTFAPDGTYRVQHYSPGNNELSGTWQLRWDALPPTLVLVCKTSDAPERIKIGKKTEVKLIQLDSSSFTYQYPGGRTYRFTRFKE